MIYRPIGKTGMSASIIGLGTEHLDNKPYEVCEEVIDAALAHDINILDLFMPGTPVRENIGRALKGRRDQVLIQGHVGSVDLREQYDRTRDVPTCQKYFENLLRSLKTDYIDFGMVFFVDTEDDYQGVFETEYIDYVLKLKEQGKIRAIGASSHNPKTAARVVETGVLDLLMFATNPAYDMLAADADIGAAMEGKIDRSQYDGMDPDRAYLYRLCESKGIAITTMKTLGAGKLLSPDFSPFQKPLTVAQCIHYALTRPAVVSTMIGCNTRAQVLEAVNYLNLSDAERDYGEAIKTPKGSLSGHCMYCNHCLPCPVGIDIAATIRMLDIAKLDTSNIPTRIREQYSASNHQASECIECGSCEEKCPFGVKVVEHMQAATQLFE
ncbi:MAG: 4Fe-4S binding protein [Firmicutes bacterium]|nr:4Fe-4S binding protein [Bacillota bacterium]